MSHSPIESLATIIGVGRYRIVLPTKGLFRPRIREITPYLRILSNFREMYLSILGEDLLK
jgi:hypothetical protein